LKVIVDLEGYTKTLITNEGDLAAIEVGDYLCKHYFYAESEFLYLVVDLIAYEPWQVPNTPIFCIFLTGPNAAEFEDRLCRIEDEEWQEYFEHGLSKNREEWYLVKSKKSVEMSVVNAIRFLQNKKETGKVLNVVFGGEPLTYDGTIQKLENIPWHDKLLDKALFIVDSDNGDSVDLTLKITKEDSNE
tara:strand:- start:255 stop:818 length:564 start_codon:yes stop_codon:yes gene_type:complete